MADTRQAAGRAFDAFLADYQAKYPKACECLKKDRGGIVKSCGRAGRLN
jgi:hypothetical protein